MPRGEASLSGGRSLTVQSLNGLRSMLRTGLMCIDSNYNLRKWPWPIAGVRYTGAVQWPVSNYGNKPEKVALRLCLYRPGADYNPTGNRTMVLVQWAGAEGSTGFWTPLAGLSGRRSTPTVPVSKCRLLPQITPTMSSVPASR